MVGKKINFKICNKFEIKTLLLFSFVSLIIIMFSCSKDTYEEIDQETYTNVAIQTGPSNPQSITTNTSSNIKPITNPNKRTPFVTSNNQSNKTTVIRIPTVEITPTPTVEITPTPTVEIKPTPTVEIKPTPTVEIKPTPTVETTKSSGFMGYENGITWGSTTVYNGIGYFYVDDLKQYYTNANDQIGYFYSGYAEPTAFYGNIKRNPSLCGDHDGYSGFSFNNEPTLASLVENYNNSNIKYEDLNVTFGTARSECYSGLLPFTQGGRYGLIDPVSMEGNGDLLLNWWITDRGVKEFFAAPSMRGGANLTKNWEGTKKLHVVEYNRSAFGGVYNYVSNFNGRPMWVNLECGDGSEKCYIFYYKDPDGAVDKYGTLIDRGTWVVQNPEPSGEWSAASYTDAEWPWQGGWGEPIVFVSELDGE